MGLKEFNPSLLKRHMVGGHMMAKGSNVDQINLIELILILYDKIIWI